VVFSVIGFVAFAQADAGFKPDSIVADRYIKQLEALAGQDPAKLDGAKSSDYDVLERIADTYKDKDGAPLQVSALKKEHIREKLTAEEVRGYVTREAAASKGVAPEAVTEGDLKRKATEIVADDSGPGLAFQLFPIAISRMPGIWKVVVGILFFLMLLSLGIDSAFSLVEAIVSGLNDKFGFNRVKSTLIVCIASFLLGVVFCTYAGVLWLDIVDRWINSYGLVAVGLFEALLIGWFYKTAKFKKHVNKYSDFKIGLWWDICIKIITPVILIGTLVLSIIGELSKNYEGYPLWSLIVGGWLMVAAVLGSGWLFMMMRSNRGNNQAAAQNEEK
jgi:biotin transporter BioY